MSTNLFIDDIGRLANDDLFGAIEEFAKAQLVEGWRHDYTEYWDETSLKNIAAFAHTFGGLLIVGVRKQKRDAVCELPGVESESEYKTRIASAIASNISPVPSYDVFECHKPTDSRRRFCVVRVRASKALHLITKKSLLPVYVRNEDEVLPANAVELRRLIDREREFPELSSIVTERTNQLRNAMMVGRSYRSGDPESWYLSPHESSQTFLKLMLVSPEASAIELEKLHEDVFQKFVFELYPRDLDCLRRGVALGASRRGAGFYEFAFYHPNVNYEMRWHITSLGDIGFAVQMDDGHRLWSVVDVAQYIVLLTRLAIRWWEFIQFFGDGRLQVQLNIPGLDVLRATEGYYIHAFDPSSSLQFTRRDIRKDAITLGKISGNAANAEAKVNYFSAREELPRLTASLLNQLLRSLGHVADMKLLQASIESMVVE